MRRKPPSAAISELHRLLRLRLEHLTVGVHYLQRKPQRSQQTHEVVHVGATGIRFCGNHYVGGYACPLGKFSLAEVGRGAASAHSTAKASLAP